MLRYTPGSLLTLGGIGSASLVLAMKGTIEDLLSGIALKVLHVH